MAFKTIPLSRHSVRILLTWLVLACLLPGVIGATALFIYQYREGRAQLEKSTIQTARALVQAVDHHLLKVQTLAQTLATDESLAKHDFSSFHRRAREAMAFAGLGTNVVLRDREGRQHVNTAMDFDRPLLAGMAPDQVREIFETGNSSISDVFIGPVLKRPVMSVDVPVAIDGKVTYALGIGILPEHFNAILKAQHLPSDWVTAVVDRTGTIFGRTHLPERFIGHKARPELLQRMNESREGALEATTQEGIPVLTFYSRSSTTGWGVAIGIPRQTLEKAFGRTLTLLALGVAALFGAGLTLAWFMGGRIARSVSALTTPALALGRGGTAPVPQIYVKEAAEVAAAIGRATVLLQERENYLRDLIAALPGVIWTSTRDGEVDFISAQWSEYTGARLETQIGHGFIESIHPEDREKVVRDWQAAIDSQSPFHGEYRLRRHDGIYRWFSSRGIPIRGPAGEVIRWLGIITDIDDLKQTQEALLDSEQRYRVLFNNKSVAVAHQRVVVDDKGRPVDLTIEAVNETYLRILGLDRAQVEGKRVTEAFPDIRAYEIDPIDALGGIALRGGEGSFELYLPPFSKWIAINAFSIGRGEIIGMFADITNQKMAEATILQANADLERRVAERTVELTRANEALLSSNEELQRFAYIASHDLQTPLRTIASFSQLLQKDYRGRQLDGRADEYLNLVIEGARRLHALIRDLLAYSRVDSQARPFVQVNLEEVFKSVVSALGATIEETRAEVTRGELPKVLGDPGQLTQLLQNLVENGIKYHGRELPRVHVWAERQEEGWRISVRDNGIGIAPKHQEAIFEVFRRLHTQRTYPGTGIGLSICRRVVERHGGRIWAESEPGKGSIFCFTLPFVKDTKDHGRRATDEHSG